LLHILSVLLIATVASATSDHLIDAIDSNGEPYIINGVEAKPNSWPWMVRLPTGCGASLIAPSWVLTAAHCIGRPGGSVIFGAHDLRKKDEDEPTRARRIVKRYIVHPEWKRSTIQNDIALVELTSPVNFTEVIFPVRLPSYTNAKQNLTGTPVTMIGWGRPSQSSPRGSPVLRQATTPILSNYECKILIKERRGQAVLIDSGVCTSHRERKTGCHGDSGSPVNWKRPDGKFVQVGIASFVPGGICDREGGVPTGHARVSSFLKWISERTGIKIDE